MGERSWEGSGRSPGHLRVALLTYRGNPRSGGQGVYVRRLSQALADLGHQVEVLSGPPYPDLEVRENVRLTRLPSLDLYRPEAPFRPQRPIRGLVDLLEFGIMCSAGFPEPLTFSLRAWAALRRRSRSFDLVHDNQCLGYGLLGIALLGLPVLATIHHPIQIDRRLELAHAPRNRRAALRRWYRFVRMQARVARRLGHVITVSAAAREDVVREMGVRPERITVVPNGVDTEFFRPLPNRPRRAGRIVSMAGLDAPIKGLSSLLHGFARLRTHQPAELVIVGCPRPDGPAARLLKELRLDGSVRFLNRVSDHDLIQLYASAEVAVVPSLYEGFSLPALEAMACGVPLVASRVGGLPEVTGPDGEAALLVPPDDPEALARALLAVLSNPHLGRRLGAHGRERATRCFSWGATARATVDVYRMVLARAAGSRSRC